VAVQRWNPETVAAPASSYSMVARAPQGATIVQLAGQVGITPEGDLEEGAEAQALAAFSNIERLLAAVGATPADLLHLRTYVVGREALAGFRSAREATYARWFGVDPPPTHTLLVVAGLSGEDMLVEVEALVATP